MLWLTVSNDFDKSINTTNVCLLLLKELHILFASSIRACSVEWNFLNSNCLSNRKFFLVRYSWSLLYIILSSIFEKHGKTDIGPQFVKYSLFPDFKIGVTLPNFSFSGMTASFIESPKILIRGFLIWLYIWFITLTSICSKPGALFIFSDLNAFKNSSAIKGFSCSFEFGLLM